MIFYTSDLHLGHANVIRFDKRPFADVEEMDQYIIARWNERVSEDDTVYILGDICHRNSRDSSWYLKQLKGHKILILGNHDNPILKNKSARSCLDKVDKMMQVVDEKRQITLCHYPIVEWNAYFHGSWHIYGHIHNKTSKNGIAYKQIKDFYSNLPAYNCGVDVCAFEPRTLDELIHLKEVNKDEPYIN